MNHEACSSSPSWCHNEIFPVNFIKCASSSRSSVISENISRRKLNMSLRELSLPRLIASLSFCEATIPNFEMRAVSSWASFFRVSRSIWWISDVCLHRCRCRVFFPDFSLIFRPRQKQKMPSQRSKEITGKRASEERREERQIKGSDSKRCKKKFASFLPFPIFLVLVSLISERRKRRRRRKEDGKKGRKKRWRGEGKDEKNI